MHIIKTIAACVALTGCVPADCVSGCYITEQQAYETRWEQLCEKHTFDRRCEGRSPSPAL
ncbi:hypothetical protein D3M70_29530 [Pseudomonas sp. LS-2]|jgi:hypothetical protein|nr:hypothetical protein D3M70_29530 [Pseudomonas sp. LS-2]